MATCCSSLGRFLFCTVVCLLICGVFASELPEHLTLTNETSNDYIVRSPNVRKSIQALSSPRQEASVLVANMLPLVESQMWSGLILDSAPQPHSLFILHSVLRR